MGDALPGGQKPTATLQQLIGERCYDLFDQRGGLLLGTGHRMPVDIGGDARLGMTSVTLDCVDGCSILQQDRDRSVPQVMETDGGQASLSKDLFESPRDLGLVDVGADRGREDHTVFLPPIARRKSERIVNTSSSLSPQSGKVVVSRESSRKELSLLTVQLCVKMV